MSFSKIWGIVTASRLANTMVLCPCTISDSENLHAIDKTDAEEFDRGACYQFLLVITSCVFKRSHCLELCIWYKPRQGGGIEPLHVSMPHELKSCPSTSLTHPGIDWIMGQNKTASVANVLSLVCSFFALLIGGAVYTSARKANLWKEPPVGFEPTTSRLLSGCSAN